MYYEDSSAKGVHFTTGYSGPESVHIRLPYKGVNHHRYVPPSFLAKVLEEAGYEVIPPTPAARPLTAGEVLHFQGGNRAGIMSRPRVVTSVPDTAGVVVLRPSVEGGTYHLKAHSLLEEMYTHADGAGIVPAAEVL